MEENERRFEQDIETYLLSQDGGYIKEDPQDFDRECALNKKDLFIALAIRLKLPIDKCFINEFDEKTLEKAIKELKYML